MKILLIRFSSAGDVLLTSPVIRCLKQQLSGVQVHFLTKQTNADLVRNNPYVDKLIAIPSAIDSHQQAAALVSTIECLKSEHYDYIVDLHNNHRSRRVRRALHLPCSVYRKENIHKFLFILTKKNMMSGRHTVDRYLDALQPLNITDDGRGLDCFLPDNPDLQSRVAELTGHTRYIVLACGAQHATKRIPIEKISFLCNNLQRSIVLVGDNSDNNRIETADIHYTDTLDDCSSRIINLCGKTTLTELAAIVKNAAIVVTPDSLTLHLAAAFQRPAITVWGATNPSFGFSSYRAPHQDFVADHLSCHPCSRMGTEKCPRSRCRCNSKQNFKCMSSHDWQQIVKICQDTIDMTQVTNYTSQNKNHKSHLTSHKSQIFKTILFFLASSLTISLNGQTLQKSDSTIVVETAWQRDTIDGLVLHRHHFAHNDCLGSNQYVSVIEIPYASPYHLEFSYETTRTPTSLQALKHKAAAAVNGSFFDMAHHYPICYLRIDGKELGINTPQKTDSVHRKYYQYGTLALQQGKPIFVIPDSTRMAERNIPFNDVMTAGPMLVWEGQSLPMRNDKTFVTERHNRTAIGIRDDETILLVTVDGRTKESAGMSLTDFATLLRYLGCRYALNLDGGGSTTMYVADYPHNGVVNHPSDNGHYDFKGERGVSNCILVIKD